LLTEAFFKEHPVSKYHGTRFQDGNVHARMSNPMVAARMGASAERIYALTEAAMFEMILQARGHQRRCPIDTRNLAELAVHEKALVEVQAEKTRCGLPLDAPSLKGPFVLTVIPGGQEPV